MIKIILCGCNGKMGRVISENVKSREDCKIVAGIDIDTTITDYPVFSSPTLVDIKADVIIDFSHPSLIADLLEFAVTTATPIVVSTTGYTKDQVELIHRAAKKVAVFHSANMSLGVNLIKELAQQAVRILGAEFDIEIVERHHNQKLDAPSGTAMMLADAINDEVDSSYRYIYDRHSVRKKRDKNEIGIHAVRGGTIVGDHDIIFAGRDEVITISHSANSREVFGVGSVSAALFLSGRKPGLYQMSDMIRSC